MGAVGSSEQIICQTTRCKIPEDTSSYSTATTPNLLSLNNLYSLQNNFIFY